MKLDVEGAEYEILTSPSLNCLQYVRNLIIEIHQMPGRLQSEVTSALAAAGLVEAARSSDNVFHYRNPAI